ncbi:MAG: hypothetical protein CV089_18210 [Nitrospira sp. WS110]|nr:hypothetical protein [Nitrospira sp. WS110]
MWSRKYWSPRYWAGRYWAHATLTPPCLPVDVSIRFRYGTGRHWGTGWKYGFGDVVDPYLPTCADPCFVPRFSINDASGYVVQFAGEAVAVGSFLLWIDSANVLRVRSGERDEQYYLQDSLGQWWLVLVSASTGSITRTPVSGPGGAAGMSVMDANGNVWVFSITPTGALMRQLGGSTIYVPESIGTLPTFTEETC